MGTVILWDKAVNINGTKWEIEADTTTSDMVVEDGVMFVRARKKSDNTESFTHGAMLSLECATDTFERKFINAFIASQEFRDKCLIENNDSLLTKEAEAKGGVPNIPIFENPKKNQQIARLIKLGNKVKFKDFVALRSGRDAFSKQKEPDLRANPDVNAKELDDLLTKRNQTLEAADYVKTLRWMARGLPTDLALRKTLVDLELAQKRKR